MLQIVAIILFIVKDSTVVGNLLGRPGLTWADYLSWTVMVVAVAFTILSMLDYFYHARDVLTGPWTGEGGARTP